MPVFPYAGRQRGATSLLPGFLQVSSCLFLVSSFVSLCILYPLIIYPVPFSPTVSLSPLLSCISCVLRPASLLQVFVCLHPCLSCCAASRLSCRVPFQLHLPFTKVRRLANLQLDQSSPRQLQPGTKKKRSKLQILHACSY